MSFQFKACVATSLVGATIPANTTATVYVPATRVDKITERGEPLLKARGVKFLRMESGRAVLAVESGDYRFTSQL